MISLFVAHVIACVWQGPSVLAVDLNDVVGFVFVVRFPGRDVDLGAVLLLYGLYVFVVWHGCCS